ncbi:MAG: AAA domain-containing protein [Candidatus Omnitrophica bacterium]|nr:AAA domain-containing protein [Candidatus Omnitrophota bacterium]
MNSADTQKNGLAFIKEVAKYFMDFLETDFHKRKNPRRSVKLRSEDNLLLGVNLNKYPTFYRVINNLINHNFDKNVAVSIEKGVHRTNIPKNLLDLINLQVEKISAKQISEIADVLNEKVVEAATYYKKEYDQALNVSIAAAAQIIKDKIVLPLIQSIEKSLENLGLGDENSIYLMEEELTSVLVRLMENKLSELIKRLIVDERVSVSKELKSIFSLSEVKSSIDTFFESFQVADIFTELFEMERNKNILDKQDFYLYFFDITFNRVKFPIFYIPFSLIKNNDSLSFDFDAQVYINKKALDFITQEYNQQTGKKGNLKTIAERIIYLAQHATDFRIIINTILSEMVNFFELDSSFDLSNPQPQIAKSQLVRVSNASYINLFDKSDEALINDYEEILKLLSIGDNKLAAEFNRLIDDFIHKNPKPFNPVVEDEWDDLGTSDKLVFASPIPLNSEQRQILSAIRKDGCKYITVEGPPGTGKSHTITAIVCDAILRNQSTLVLSDKKEALDVVEDKITETMNKVRHDKNFQNPLLRLGKTGSTYSQILSTAAIENIKVHSRAVKKDYKDLEENIGKLTNTLKEDLEAEALKYDEIDINRIHELLDLESYYDINGFPIEVEEIINLSDSAIELEEFRRIFISIENSILASNDKADALLGLFKLSYRDFKDISMLSSFLRDLVILDKKHLALKEKFSQKLELLNYFIDFQEADLKVLEGFITQCKGLRSGIFGYLFKSDQLKRLDDEFNRKLPNSKFKDPHKHITKIEDIFNIFNLVCCFKNELLFAGISKVDCVNVFFKLLTSADGVNVIKRLIEIGDDLNYLIENLRKYPKTLNTSNVGALSLDSFCDNAITKIPATDFERFINFIDLRQKLSKSFGGLIRTNYPSQKKQIEELVTTQMTYLMDNRLINFYENNRADAKTLRDIIKSKQKFPKNEFAKMKEAFPCILAGIRDYAEYIPLDPEIFDLVIIDEASQVSIAQAFPALLRAKKVLILGDKKQFSNVKAAQARSDTNREYLNSLEACFRDFVTTDSAGIVKLRKFNIKTSILDFFEFICNYNTQLMKHFRGYKEIIGYSNKHFYGDSLQVMKIRGKSIDEVLKFNFVNCSAEGRTTSSDLFGSVEMIQNTNAAEIDFIIAKLNELKAINSSLSVGIITPHTNQQKLIMEMISKLPDRDHYFDKMKLKIMTFDTCQGEERDVIFYSMVATKESDRLWGVFVKDLNNVDVEEDGKIKAQRLNVGFSRAKETMVFVLSKPLDEYSGAVGEALRYYWNTYQEAKKEPLPDSVDPNSPKEKEVLNWLTQTDFWRKGAKDGRVSLMPQFEIGKYLKQLDKMYDHPKYKVDFLLVYKDEFHKEHKIIIEYDGFSTHFIDHSAINGSNYRCYYSDDDLYREKVLESYGYKFLRINRFNVGKNPIATLNERLERLINDNHRGSDILSNIHETIEGLQNGNMKECPKCKEIRVTDDFKDASLVSGYGRFCKYCKHPSLSNNLTKREPPKIDNSKRCPRCSSGMILRNGRRGKFYGCSRFPSCRGTRECRGA